MPIYTAIVVVCEGSLYNWLQMQPMPRKAALCTFLNTKRPRFQCVHLVSENGTCPDLGQPISHIPICLDTQQTGQ